MSEKDVFDNNYKVGLAGFPLTTSLCHMFNSTKLCKFRQKYIYKGTVIVYHHVGIKTYKREGQYETNEKTIFHSNDFSTNAYYGNTNANGECRIKIISTLY